MKLCYLLPLAALMLAPAIHADARTGSDGPAPGERMIERLDERADLDLSDAQKQQIRTLMLEEQKQHETTRKQYEGRMEGVLNPAQRSKLEKHRKEAMAKQAERLEQRARELQAQARELRSGK